MAEMTIPVQHTINGLIYKYKNDHFDEPTQLNLGYGTYDALMKEMENVVIFPNTKGYNEPMFNGLKMVKLEHIDWYLEVL